MELFISLLDMLDASNQVLYEALTGRGFDVTRTPTAWIRMDASDEAQLLGATAQGRCIITFNIGDFSVLAQRHPDHSGIILAAQRSWTLSDLIKVLGRLLSETQAEDWPGQVRWLNEMNVEIEFRNRPFLVNGEHS